MQQNYFIFVVTREKVSADIKIGDIGVGETDICVGIKDAPYGVLMVAPASHIQKCALRDDGMSPVALSSEQIKEYVFDFWNRKPLKKSVTQKEKEVVWMPHTW